MSDVRYTYASCSNSAESHSVQPVALTALW